MPEENKKPAGKRLEENEKLSVDASPKDKANSHVHAHKNLTKQGEGGLLTWNNIALFAVFVLVLSAVVLYVNSSRVHEYQVFGLRVYSAGNPQQAIKQVLSEEKIVVELNVYKNDAGDSRNGFISLLVVDLGYGLGASERPVGMYGRLAGTEEFVEGTCTEETNFCTSPHVVVELDDCNCIRVENGRIRVLYDAENMQDPDLRFAIRGLFGGVVNEQGTSS